VIPPKKYLHYNMGVPFEILKSQGYKEKNNESFKKRKFNKVLFPVKGIRGRVNGAKQ
jgi:hypothetical protein